MIDDGNELQQLRKQNAELKSALERVELEKEAILDGVCESILYVNKDMKVIYANKAMGELVGMPLEQMVGRCCYELRGRDEVCTDCNVLEVIESNKPHIAEKFHLYGRLGSSRTCPVRNEAGNLLGVFKIGGNVEEVRKAEQALRESRERHSLIVEASNEGIWQIDEEGRTTFVNQRMAEMLGYTVQEMMGQILFAFMDEEWRKVAEANIQRRRQEIRGQVEYKYLRKDGTVLWAINSAYPIFRDDGGYAGIIGMHTDITERKQAEHRALIEKKRLQSTLAISQLKATSIKELLDHVHDAIVDLSDSLYSFINFYNEETKIFTIHPWPKPVLDACSIIDKPTYFELEKTGIWGEAVRQRKPIIINDFAAPNPLKRGYPEGHIPLTRFMTIPVFIDNKIVAVVTVANKKADYTELDVTELILMMDFVWNIIQRWQVEDELRAAHQQLSQIIEFLPDPTLVVDSDRKVIAWNRAIEEMTGIRKEDIIGKGDYAYVVPFYGERRPILVDLVFMEDAETVDKYIDVDKKGDALYAEAFTTALHGGRGAYLRGTASPLYNSQGNIIGAIESIRDITEYKRAKEAELLREFYQRNSEILESITDAFYAVDGDWRLTYVNSKAEEWWHRRREDLLGTVLWDLYPDYKTLQLYDELNRAMRERIPLHFEMQSPHYPHIWFGVNVYPDSPDGLSVYFLDITKRKKAEEALRQSEERFSRLFHNNPDILNMVSIEDNRIVDINQKFTDVLGYTREEVIGRTMEELKILADEKSYISGLFKDLHERGELQNFEFNYRAKSGKIVNGLCSTQIATINGKDYRLNVIKDITNEKRMEAEMARLDRLDLMGQIAAGIAHEIRNPLTVVSGNLQVLQMKEEFASHQKRFDAMIAEIDRANAIITEFLSLAKNVAVNLKKQNINSIVNTLLPLIQADATRHEVAVSADLADVPDLELDGQQIRQLILNLVRNGIESMSRHGELTIKTRQKYDQVILFIRDKGKGIPPEVLEKIGTPFFSTKVNGTGLGLPVCYKIAKNHKAKIEIKTGKRGTIVLVSFPIQADQG